MEKDKNKNPAKLSENDPTGNHHANPSRINPGVTAVLANEHAHKHQDTSEQHSSMTEDKRATARELHTNGSTKKGEL